MIFLKRFFESREQISDESLALLKETYLDLCDMLDDVIEDGVTVRIQTGGTTWGLLIRKNVDHFIEFCKSLNKKTYYLQFEFTSRCGVFNYRRKNDGKFPEWLISDLGRVVDYLNQEGWNNRTEVKVPNPRYNPDYDPRKHSGMGNPRAQFKISYVKNVDELNKWFNTTICIYILFGTDKNLQRGDGLNSLY